MHRSLLLAILAIALAGCVKPAGTVSPAGDSSGDHGVTNKTNDQELIQGTWVLVGMEMEGKMTPAADPKDPAPVPLLTFKGNAVIDSSSPNKKTSFKLEPDKKPPVITEVNTLPNGTTTTMKRAYELQGDRLRFCDRFADPTNPPTEFNSNNRQVIWSFQRQKNPDK